VQTAQAPLLPQAALVFPSWHVPSASQQAGQGVQTPLAQTRQAGQGGSQRQEPQSIFRWQLFLTMPHVPAQVLARDLALHLRLFRWP
jgi:hypothetical protein